jgi:hypothetical protein
LRGLVGRRTTGGKARRWSATPSRPGRGDLDTVLASVADKRSASRFTAVAAAGIWQVVRLAALVKDASPN